MDFPNLRWLYFTDRPAPKKVRVLSIRGKIGIMNIYDAMLRDNPVAAYRFGTTPATSFANLMGDSNAISVPQKVGVNAAIYPGSMISGPGNAIVVGDGWTASWSLPNRFNKVSTGLPFSIEMVVKFLDISPTGSILASHSSSTDGLYFDGDLIWFKIDLDGGGTVIASWAVPDKTQNYHIVGTYSSAKICLYVDGTLVSSTDIPEGSVLASKASDVLSCGFTTPRVLLEAPAVYAKELNANQVLAHFQASRQNTPTTTAVGAYGGRLFKFTDNERDVLFKDPIDWRSEGFADNVVVGDYLQPVYGEDDLSLAGTFTYSVNSADTTSGTTYQGMKLEWNGDGNFTVEHSINSGTSWTSSVNGSVQANTIGMSATIPPMIRITFAAGRAKNLDIVRDMTATIYSSLTLRAVNDRERSIIFSGATANTSSEWAEPIEMDDGAGTKINQVNAVLQESIETDLTNIGTVEMWIKLDALGGSYLFDARNVTPSNPAYMWTSGSNLLSWPATLSAVYVNGVATTNATFTPVVGRWYHIVAVWATPFNSKINFTTQVGAGFTNQMNMMAHYEAQLTAAQALALYNSYFGNPALAIADANTVVVSETAPAAKAYVNDWSIQGAG